MTDTTSLYILHECAAGYALFHIPSFEEIGSLLSSESITSLDLFGQHVKLTAFQPFESAEDALSNANAISEHAMTFQLKSFLEMNLPSSPETGLGVLDPGLATAIAEGMGDNLENIRSDDQIREIVRGIRLHLPSFIKGLKDGALGKAQLGLGHSYSRTKVKFNPARSDNMIIQSIALLDQMDKDLNTFAMRVREWYSWHFPELKSLVSDNYMFARCAAFIQDKSCLCPPEEGDEEAQEDKVPGLIEIVGDEEIAKGIVSAARTSMGMDCTSVDMVNIVNFTQRMVKLAEFRTQLAGYLNEKMSVVAPNLSTLIGDTLAARLISKAGSLTNLAKAPASTVQILGAEKALFRALKTKGNTPKYGLIYHSTFIGRADSKNKGRISRYLANKCSIATRIDSFSEEPSTVYGEKLREQVEERLKFYETGSQPRRNVDVMEEVAKSLARGKMDVEGDEEKEGGKKKKKKKKKKEEKKRKAEEEPVEGDEEVEDKATKKSAKKAAKRAKKEAAVTEDDDIETPSKKKQKMHDKQEEDDDKVDKSAEKAAKKAKRDSTTPQNKKEEEEEAETEATPQKSKEAETPLSAKTSSSKKKKKKKKKAQKE